MKLLDKNKIDNRFGDIYDFLRRNNNKWLRNYFPDRESFYGFLHENEDITVLAYENEASSLDCADLLIENSILTVSFSDEASSLDCVGLLFENSILTVSFSDEADNEDGYNKFFSDVENFLSSMSYTSVYFGDGDYSFGIYDEEHDNKFDDYLEKIGFSVESVRYDIRHMVKSLKEYNGPKSYEVYKFDFKAFKNNLSLNTGNSIIEDIALNYYKYPQDDCYVAIKKGVPNISGFVLLDTDSATMDSIVVREENPLLFKKCKEELLSSIANDLDSKGISSLVETQVDQLEGQRLKKGDFEVCGIYKTMSKRIKK